MAAQLQAVHTGAVPEKKEPFKHRLDSGPDLDRTIYFSDAVFAIAMTLLAVDIHVPQVPPGELGSAILKQAPEFSRTHSPSP